MTAFRTHLLVCTGTGCVSCGSFDVRLALEEEVRRRGLEREILVVATGCNGFCERGPIVVVQPDGVLYQQEEDLSQRCRDQLDDALKALRRSVRKAR